MWLSPVVHFDSFSPKKTGSTNRQALQSSGKLHASALFLTKPDVFFGSKSKHKEVYEAFQQTGRFDTTADPAIHEAAIDYQTAKIALATQELAIYKQLFEAHHPNLHPAARIMPHLLMNWFPTHKEVYAKYQQTGLYDPSVAPSTQQAVIDYQTARIADATQKLTLYKQLYEVTKATS